MTGDPSYWHRSHIALTAQYKALEAKFKLAEAALKEIAEPNYGPRDRAAEDRKDIAVQTIRILRDGQ